MLRRFALLLVLAAAPPALAQAPAAGEKWEAASLGSHMVQPGETGYSSPTLVSVAYGFIWVMVTGFVGAVWLRGRRVERELADLEQRLAKRVKEGS